METYKLSQLLIFWHSIRGSDYEPINEIGDLIDNDDVPDDDKKDMILDILRHHGLYEIQYQEEPKIFEDVTNEIEGKAVYSTRVDILDVEVENAIVQVVIFLN